ncbi:hypothetical protein EYF80_035042 [Liparis tanakae]|uniref:Uncharacterized protein n=1 Tax=Liparis tanakae TaxID=230148 RepID=A0A4Z2GN55_9TELE|nr:hypothetical protein EYF80_035042 [Liparis tanakae]
MREKEKKSADNQSTDSKAQPIRFAQSHSTNQIRPIRFDPCRLHRSCSPEKTSGLSYSAAATAGVVYYVNSTL